MSKRILIAMISVLWLPVVVVNGQRQLPITITATPANEVFKSGGPLLLQVTITNNFSQEIRFESFFRGPDSWDGNTTNIVLPDIYRDSQPGNVFKSRPAPLNTGAPSRIAGMSSKAIKPGESLSLMIDVSKWQIIDGWTTGKYKLIVRVDNIVVDAYSKVSVASDPLTIEIK